MGTLIVPSSDHGGITLKTITHLDLDDNCQTPSGYCSNEVCTPMGKNSRQLEDGTKANEVMEYGNEFHAVIVLAAKDLKLS